jgi:hypothetical protein
MARTAARKPASRRPVADVVRHPAAPPHEPRLTLDQRMLRAIWIDLIGGLSIVPPGRAPEVVDARIAALRHEGDQP